MYLAAIGIEIVETELPLNFDLRGIASRAFTGDALKPTQSGVVIMRAAIDHHIRMIIVRQILVAGVAVVPLQDLLGLGTEARMNLPNSTAGNWSWRFNAGALSDELATRLRDLAALYGRVAAGRGE